MWSGYSEQGRGGQERGPGGFAAQVPNAPSAYVAGQDTSPVQAGVRGGGVAPTGNVVVPERQDKTMQTLLRLGQEQLGKQIVKLEEQAFLEGWAKAASGTALDELQAEQPGWSRVFGDSATVEGARAYQAQSMVDNWVVATEQKMDELRKLPPSAVPKQLYSEIEGMLTGDAATDSLIRAQLFKAATPLIKRHAKEHVGWQQEEARDSRGRTFRSSAARLETMAKAEREKPGTYTEDDIKKARLALMTSITPQDGANVPTWEKDVVDFFVEAASNRQFGVVNTLRETGALDNLDPDSRARVDAAISRAASPALVEVSPKFVGRLLDLQSNPDLTDEEVMAGIAQINAEASAASGVPLEDGQLVPFGQYDSYIAAARNAKSAAERGALKAKAAAIKAHEEAVSETRLTNTDGSGILDTYAQSYDENGKVRGTHSLQLLISGAKPAEIEKAALGKFLSLPAQERGKFIGAFPSHRFDVVQNMMDSWWAQVGQENTDWQTAGAAYSQLADVWAATTEHARGQYFSADQQQEMTNFLSARAAGVPPESAFLLRKQTVQAAKGRYLPPKKEALVEAIADQAEDVADDFSAGVIANIVGHIAAKNPVYGVDDDVAAKRAYGKAVSDGWFSVVGKTPVVNVDRDGARAAPLERVVGHPPELTARVFNSMVAERISASGGNPDESIVLRLPDMGGKARYMVEATTADGKSVFAQLDSDEVKAAVLAQRKGSVSEQRLDAEKQRGNEAAARQREAAKPLVFEINR